MPPPRAGMPVARTPAARLAVIVLVVLALVAIWLIVSGRDSTSGAGSTPGARSSATSSYGQPGSSGGTEGGSGATPRSDLPTVAESQLNAQARRTLALIRSGGPYPYDQDGRVFTNRERLLPRQASGYYREFTVVTPGSPDRGARRIIAGDGGDLYYTDDHYASFRQIEEGT